MRRSFLLLLPFFALAACKLGPNYKGPPPVGSASSEDARFVRGGNAVAPGAPAAAHWWTALGDPKLDTLEDRALAGNYNVAAAEARVREARAALRGERANELPQLAATGMYAHADLPPISLGGPPPSNRTVLNFFNVGFDASWEIDLFGGERVWTYDLEFNDTDGRLLALEYFELGACISSVSPPEVTLEEGRRDLALTYAPFESGLLGRPVTLDEVLSGAASAYQSELDARLGLQPV